MTTPIQIRKEQVVRDIRKLAEITGRPITDAVAAAVRSELDRAQRADDVEARRKRIRELVDRVSRLPIVGPELTDADLYDEDGMPR